jgi:hypothetical protein
MDSSMSALWAAIQRESLNFALVPQPMLLSTAEQEMFELYDQVIELIPFALIYTS